MYVNQGWNYEQISVRRMQKGWRLSKTTSWNMPKLRIFMRVRIRIVCLIRISIHLFCLNCNYHGNLAATANHHEKCSQAFRCAECVFLRKGGNKIANERSSLKRKTEQSLSLLRCGGDGSTIPKSKFYFTIPVTIEMVLHRSMQIEDLLFENKIFW